MFCCPPVMLSFLIFLFNRDLEPHLDQTQHLPIYDSPCDALHQFAVRNGIEVLGQIGINHVGVAAAQKLVYFPDGVLRAPFRSIAKGIGIEVRLEDRLQHQFGSGLYHPVPNRRNAERPFPTPGLRDHHPSHWLWLVRLSAQFFPDTRQPLLHSRDSISRNVWSSTPGAPALAFRQLVSVTENDLPTDLVVEQVEAVGRFCLRFEVQLSLKSPDLIRCCQAHRQSPLLVFFQSTSEVRALPSPGITRLPRYYDPFRRPVPAGILFRCRWRRALHRTGPPPITQITLPACRAHYPGGPNRCTCRLLPCPRGLPRISGGSASTTSLLRPAQASLALRPTSLLAHHTWALLRGFDPASLPADSPVSYQVLPTTTWVGPSPTSDLRDWGALRNTG